MLYDMLLIRPTRVVWAYHVQHEVVDESPVRSDACTLERARVVSTLKRTQPEKGFAAACAAVATPVAHATSGLRSPRGHGAAPTAEGGCTVPPLVIVCTGAKP